MKSLLHTLVLLMFLMPFFGITQNEKNHWFFGQNAYIDFNTPGPTVGTGNLSTGEGCATVSDSSGGLLFYTDGITVYDKNGVVMPNGTGLKGDPSSTHSALVVPNPCDVNIFYIFTTAAIGQDGMYYYEVDLSLNGGMGDVISGSEVLLLIDATEKIASVKHTNGIDFWVSTTRQVTGFTEVYTWGVTAGGVNTTPNIFTSTHPTNITHPTYGSTGNYPGQLKFNTDGTLLAAAQLYADEEIDLYQFDTTTGTATSFIDNIALTDSPYGVEFSPNGDYLYGTSYFTQRVFQIDITNTASIPAPSFLGSISGTRGGALQLAPNGLSIYAAEQGTSNIGEITAINTAAAGYTTASLSLQPGTLSSLGLPTFVSGTQGFASSCIDFDPFTNAVPTLFNNGVKTELVIEGFMGIDKEYGDIDNDGDIDILYQKNNHQLHALINTAGIGVNPIYTTPGSPVLSNTFTAHSYRLYDWNSDGSNDIVVLGVDVAAVGGVWVFLNNGAGVFPVNGTLVLDGVSEFNFVNDYLIAIGDLSNDGNADLLISNQDFVLDGTAYFEGTGNLSPPYFTLTGTQVYTGTQITNPFIPDNSGSYHTPEIYDADCDGDLDLFISDPLMPAPTFGGARMYYHENNGGVTTGTLPDVNVTGVINQFGFDDDPGSASDLACDWIITRIVPYINPNCPIAIAYNPCNDEFYYYDQDCGCDGTGTSVLATEDFEIPEEKTKVKVYPNPATDQFNVWSEVPSNSIALYDISGKLVLQLNDNKSSINISHLNTGIYFVKIKFENTSQTLQLIKK